MKKVIINGTLTGQRQGVDVYFDANRGLRVRERYMGAGDNLAGLANAMYAQNVSFSWHRHPVVSSIEIDYSGGINGASDQAQVTWQLLANEGQVSIFKNPFVQQAFSNHATLRSDVAKWHQIWESGDVDGADAFQAAVDAAWKDDFDSIATMIKNKDTGFAVGQYVLKRTYSISSFFNGSLPGEGNAEKLIATGSFSGLPTVIQGKINSIPAPPIPLGYTWAWRQLPSTLVTSANNRVEVSTEWWLGLWNTNLYALA